MVVLTMKSLTGILGIKNNGKHISLFFIKPEYHRQGLGKKTFSTTSPPSILPLKQRLILLLMLFLSTRVWDLLS
ncbi:MAG: GNAT family N-acetyltransferase [Phocaeicola vulgatus]